MPNSTNQRSLASTSSAFEQRLDPVTGQWLILASDRADRPDDMVHAADPSYGPTCAFCAGREHETTQAVSTYGPPPGVDHGQAWQVRVVENLYPALLPLGQCPQPTQANRRLAHQPDVRPSLGLHYVIIESPTHRRRLHELQPAEIETIVAAYRDQLQRLRDSNDVTCALLFKNCGRDAGMSREHIHSQLVGLPEVPPILANELSGATRYGQLRQSCVFCDLLAQTRADGTRVVAESPTLLAFCPFASRTAYEVWILPKRHAAHFSAASPTELSEFAQLLSQVLARLERCLGKLAYNYLIHTLPFDTRRDDYYHWHLEIIPRTSRFAGLELGSGLMINTVAPELAAERLREAGNI